MLRQTGDVTDNATAQGNDGGGDRGDFQVAIEDRFNSRQSFVLLTILQCNHVNGILLAQVTV